MHDKIINLFDLEELFNQKLPIEIAGYYKSGARDEITLKKNREIFNSYELLPKLLRDVTKIDISKNLLGCNLKNPIILAPVAMQQMAHQDGEVATAKASNAHGSAMTLSTSSNNSIEDVAGHNENLFFNYILPKIDQLQKICLKKQKNLDLKQLSLLPMHHN